ncbi:hypothetical protein [uncultured Azohydromonas sp.]|jgi:hypothetical protein|uniref:hypothetical protein n=1 Tax=uncultured Azohydromonas sp. TaxID=487342 RepID=UPI00263263C7|nr:hypothetical protein [uncultured Azohydromonas sp.]
MKYLLAAAVLAAYAAAHAGAPNEAVRTLPGGIRMVEEPPGPRNEFGRPTPMPAEAWSSGAGLPGYVIETRTGRVECLQPWIEKNCRVYQPGAEQRLRAWVIKRGGQWLKCPRQDSAQCVGYYSFPLTEVQE